MKYITPILLLFLFLTGNAQTHFQNVFSKQSINSISSETVKNNLSTTASAQLLSVNQTKFESIENTSGAVTFSIPYKEGEVEIQVEATSVFSQDFAVETPDGRVNIEIPATFQGIIKGDSNSFVALTVVNGALEGIIASEKLNLTIGKVRDLAEGLSVIYNTKDIQNDTPICSNSVEFEYKGKEGLEPSNTVSSAQCRSLGVYLEADYQMYADFGNSVQSVVNHMTAIFNNVALLYTREGVNINISTLFVWTNPDPYLSATNTSQSLGLLVNYWNGQGNNFNGNIVHMVSTKSLGGGIAYLYTSGPPSVFNGMSQRAIFYGCNKSDAFGLSGNIRTTVDNLPTYSWNVMVIAHEIGHNCGLPHTHSCTWSDGVNTGALDNCATTEGSCAGGPAPINGGTVMSYCHQTSQGINLSNGFGDLPGGKLFAEFNAATCLGGSLASRPVVSDVAICANTSTTLMASGCSGTYQWFDSSFDGSLLGSSSSYTTPLLTETNNYYVSCTENGCTSKRMRATVSVLGATPEVTNQRVCAQNNIAILTANCAGATVNWYTDETVGTPFAVGNNYSLENITSSTTVYVACSTSGCVSQRAALQITYTEDCSYCEPTGLDCTDDDVITQVSLNYLSTNLFTNNSTCIAGGFSVFTPSNPVQLLENQTYELSISNPGVWKDGLSVWLDYNRNGIFESSEMVESFFPDAYWTQHTFNFTVPQNTSSGTTRIRVKVNYSEFSSQPCSSSDGSGFGEIEDYIITLGIPCATSLTLQSTADDYSSGTVLKEVSNTNGTITATNKITGNAKVTYNAGRSVVLKSGFTAASGTVFLVEMGGCVE